MLLPGPIRCPIPGISTPDTTRLCQIVPQNDPFLPVNPVELPPTSPRTTNSLPRHPSLNRQHPGRNPDSPPNTGPMNIYRYSHLRGLTPATPPGCVVPSGSAPGLRVRRSTSSSLRVRRPRRDRICDSGDQRHRACVFGDHGAVVSTREGTTATAGQSAVRPVMAGCCSSVGAVIRGHIGPEPGHR